jgi:hypothetical protein
MPGNIVHENAGITCPHCGQATVTPANQNVKVSGRTVVTVNDMYRVVGCTFTVGTKPQPCVTVTWSPSALIRVHGQPVVLATAVGVCESAEKAPQGTATINFVQALAKGT